MKKLFTTILMMGVALVGWASVTADYDEGTKTLTINYTADPNNPNELQNLNISNPPGELIKEHERNAETLVLTGDWANKDLSVIGKLVERCIKTDGPDANPNKKIFLDLSACYKMRSKVVKTDGSWNADIDWVTTEHKFVPDPNNPEQVTVTGTATETSIYYNSWAVDGNGNPQSWATPYTGEVQGDETTGYHTPDNQPLVKFPAYVDENGNQVTDVTENPDGTYSYSYTYTLDSTKFSFADGKFSNAEKYLNGIAFPNHADFNCIPEQFCVSALKSGLTTVVFGDYMEWIGAEAFSGCTSLTDPVFPATMKVFGGDCFKDCNSFTKVDLSLLPKIQIVDYMAFGSSGDNTATSNLAEFILPSNNTSLKYFANYVIRGTKVKKLDFSGCKGIVNFAHDGKATFGEFSPNWDSYWTFYGSSELEEIILPPNLVYLTEKAFNTCPKLKKVTFGDNCLLIDKAAFQKCYTLEEVKFPIHIVTIEEDAFEETGLKKVDLSACHELRTVEIGAFGTIPALTDVKICSHPKVLRGNGHGTGCFNNCKNIETVEITACHTPENPVTDITQCYCEIGAFDYDITEVQTQIDNVSKGARLIFPDDMPVGENQVYAGTTHQSGTYVDDQGVERQTFGIEQGTAYTNPYTSAFDFFVGDYKSGVLLSQTNLQVFFDNVPNNLDVAPGYGTPVNQPDLGEYVPGVSADENHKVVGDTRYAYNGWMEFINVEKSQIVPKGEFLRTYSRTAGDGPCMLPKGITAYRAVDYKSNAVGWVLDKNRKTGTHYLKEDASSDLTDDSNYVLITEETDPADYANRPLYSKVTTGGKLFLRPLVAKVAQYDGHEGYEGDNIGYFDSEEVYSQLTNVPGGYSYVPEETGVVLYSSSIDEKSFLVLGGDFGTETVYKKFPHTGDRYEEGRLSSSNTDDDINMLQGSFGTGVPVAPVFPWVYKDKTNYSGGTYTKNKEYRNFAAVKIERNGGSVVEDRYRWKRLTPSKMKINRAFASIPVNRFDNWNESVDQMPDFTIEDEVEPTNNSNLMLISVFGDEEVNGETDGIEEIKEIKTTDIIVVNANDNVWYTTQGVRVANPTKGVYIHNGKKVVIK